MTVTSRIFRHRRRCIGIHVDGDDAGGAGPGSGQRQNTGAGPDIRHPLVRQIEPADKLGEKLAGEEASRVKYGRTDDEAKPGRPGDPRRTPLEDQVVGEEVYGSAQGATPKPLWN